MNVAVTRSLRSLRSGELIVSPSATLLRSADQQAGSAPPFLGEIPRPPAAAPGSVSHAGLPVFVGVVRS